MSTTNLPTRLNDLGDALEAAATADLSRQGAVAATADLDGGATTAPRRRRLRLPRNVAIGAVALAVLIPGAALAANSLFGASDVARSMPAGTLALAGTEPTCTEVSAVEFSCTLAKAPSHEFSDWKGTVEPTVDAEGTVNGGCRSLSADGKSWDCYLGKKAVEERIIGAEFLGQHSEGPGVG
jgi:hypothetical protein